MATYRAKDCLPKCLPELTKYFQAQRKRVFQFPTATPNGALNIFHLLRTLAQLNPMIQASYSLLTFTTHAKWKAHNTYSNTLQLPAQSFELTKSQHFGTEGILTCAHYSTTGNMNQKNISEAGLTVQQHNNKTV